MFPEIVRDEVFRIESRRLWLRWPVAADAFDASATVADTGSGLQTEPMGVGYRLPGRACIAAWRAEMEKGLALHLVLEEKSDERRAIGTLHLTWGIDGALVIDFHLTPARRHEGLMTEAVKAVVRTVFLMRFAPAVTAAPRTADRAGRGVLERNDFGYRGSGLRPSPAGQGLTACDHFRLDRRAWLGLQGWGLSGREIGRRLGGMPAGLRPAAHV